MKYFAVPWRRILCLGTLPFLLAACAPTAQQESDYAVVERSGVSPAIYDKMIHGDALSVSDIVSLSQAHVSDGVITRYIRDNNTIYYLSPQDLDYLRKSGVSQSVIDFMVQTAQSSDEGGVFNVCV